MTLEEILLSKKALIINTENPFTWSSGIKSPIYCDNRKLIAYPKERSFIVDLFCEQIKKDYPDLPDAIAATATAGIPWGAWISDRLELPLLYVRSKPKAHGAGHAVEGDIENIKNCILIEDLISTGGSSLNACDQLNKTKIQVRKVYSLFSYTLKQARVNFEKSNIDNYSLSNIRKLLEKSTFSKEIQKKLETFINQN